MNIILIHKDLPYSIKAFHQLNEDGTFTIFVNSRQSIDQQKSGILHEVAHIDRNDFDSDLQADMIEKLLHNAGWSSDLSDIEFFVREG